MERIAMTGKKNVTEDIKPSWLNPVRAAQAACRTNRGYAVVTLRIVVNKNDPMMWAEPEVVKIHPARISEYPVSPTLLAVMLELADGTVDSDRSVT
jgi:hypothetical protein